MSLSLIHKPFIQQSLAITVATLLTNTAHAVTEQDELQQLRAEVRALKALIQQHIPQTQGQLIRAASAQVPAAQTAAAVSTAPVTTVKREGLSLTSAAGSSVSLYGFIRGDVQYQAAGGSSIFNRIDDVSLSGANDDKMYSSAATTRLGLDFKSPLENDKLGGKIEVDFRGNNDSLRIRHAYLTYNNWLFGQTTSTFLATDLMPEMLDFNTNLGGATHRTKMVRYANNLTSGTEYLIGLEESDDGLATSATRLPALTGKLKHSFADGHGSASLRGLLLDRRTKETSNKDGELISKKDSELAWGIGAGASYTLSDQTKVMADYYHVEGDSKYILYANDGYNFGPNLEYNQNVFDSFAVGITHQFNPKLRSILGYGIMLAEENNFARTAVMNGDMNQNERMQQGWLNVMYNPVKPITLGLEYVYGERETFDGQKGQDNRVGAMAKYAF